MLGSFANTLTVKHDGSGDYTIIKDAINSSTNSDTILVWPGTYYENVDFIGKNITLASLMLTTGDELYKYTTIIDGNKTGSCILFRSGETNAVLYGFTLQHGSGFLNIYTNETYGGGIFMDHSSATVVNCVVKDNKASHFSGGIHCDEYSFLSLSGTSIYRNQAYGTGGISVGYKSVTTFDSLNKCSIYNNYSGAGCDITQGNKEMIMHFVFDTFSVLLPTPYHIHSTDDSGFQVENYTFSTDHAFFSPIDSDVYVNPLTGNNNNSGLNPSNAFSTIAYALSSIAIDTIQKNTIHLANGYYCDTTNYEAFPLCNRPFTIIQGESCNGVILDGRYLTCIAKGNTEVSDYSYQRMTIKHGGYKKYNGFEFGSAFTNLYQQNDNVLIDSVNLTHCWNGTSGALTPINSNNVIIKDCRFTNTLGGTSASLSGAEGDTCWVYNCKFIDNMPDFNNPGNIGGIALSSRGSKNVVVNTLFTGNNQMSISNWLFADLYLLNCTFTNNTLLTNNYSSISSHDASLYMYNCISYNEGITPLSLSYNESQDTVKMEIYNSLIEGGIESIDVEPGLTKLHYDVSNIDANPLFYGGTEFPYNLSENSPCIDAGTLEIPEWIVLPETDLAGNPRIFNDAIDMGAYEWNPTVGVNEYNPIKKDKEKLLVAAPNPFSSRTTITATYTHKSNYKIEIYNNYGQRVRVLFNGAALPGNSKIIWNDVDDNGKQLPSGIYYVIMFENEDEIENLKIILSD